MTSNPVINKLRELSEQESSKVKVLSSGIRVIIEGVSNFEIQDISTSVEVPPPPRFKDPDTGREFENYDDPTYQYQLTQANLKRGMMVLDAMLIGVRLVDGLPEDDGWINLLRFKEKRKLVDLSDLDFNNPLEKEYAYKKYVAFAEAEDWKLLQDKVQEIKGATQKADAMFPSDEEWGSDSGPSSEEGSQGS